MGSNISLNAGRARGGSGGPGAAASPRVSPAAKAALGIYAKLRNPPPTQIQAGPSLRRILRYQLQSIARGIIGYTRIGKCLRARRKGADSVTVRKGKDRAYYSDLQTCGSVWNCPVCAAKIAESRRKDIDAAISSWKESDGEVLHLSFTVRHHAGQSLQNVVDGICGAMRLMKNRKPYKRIVEEIGLFGTIRALEVTYGENGWHVHFHVLWLVHGESDFDAFFLNRLEALINKIWRDACKSSGAGLPNERGVTIEKGDSAGGYIAKWGLGCELAKSHIKAGREGHYTPWDFLRMYDEDKRWGDRFEEYSRVFKGKHQIQWSKGLFKYFFQDRKEKTDAELASEIDELDPILGQLSFYKWGVILHKEVRGEFLEVVYSEGWQAAIWRFLRE